MQTILGAGGDVGADLADELRNRGIPVRLASRHAVKKNPNDDVVTVDVLEKTDVERAVNGSEVVYLTVGFPYSAKVWEHSWPVAMANVLEACAQYSARLVFLDNIYMLDPQGLPSMNESTPYRPVSRKGKVREQVAQMLETAVQNGQVQALTARSADFYGPNCQHSVLIEMAVRNLVQGKPALVPASATTRHNYTFVPDLAKALAILGQDPTAIGQVWHLPTARPALTGHDWVQLIAAEAAVSPRYRVVPAWALRAMGLVSTQLRELGEMLYQYERDYEFDSSKFEKRYQFTATPPTEAVKHIVSQQSKRLQAPSKR